MTDLNLTPEERNIAVLMARDDHGVGWRIGFYASILIPMMLFAGYGLINQDAVAVLIAFLGILIFTAWRVGRELSLVRTYKSLFRKVLEHERGAREQI